MARILLIAVLACAHAGCWEEIHYTPPPPGSEPVATVKTTAAPTTEAATTAEPTSNLGETDHQASNFGDDVAASLAEEPQETIAAANSAPATLLTEDTPAEEPQPGIGPNSRLAAWSLGSTLSLASLANDRAASEDKVTGWFETARQQAAALGTTVADLPPRPADDEVDIEGVRAMNYLFEQGRVVGPRLTQAFGDDHNALFEVALKSNILLVRYQPGAPIAKLLAAGVRQASERAGLPPELVEPMLQLVESGATVKEVRDAVFDMHDKVREHLSTATP